MNSDFRYHLVLQSFFLSIFILLVGLPLNQQDDIAVSVIVPVYNVEKYLPQCLNSILNQSFKNIELICVNDHSTDGSLEIIKDFVKKDKRVVLIDNLKNVGPGTSRNQAIQIAKGEYLSFIDSDDWINPNFLKKLYFKAKIEKADLCVCLITNFNSSMNQFYTRGEFLRNRMPDKFTKKHFSWVDIANDVFVVPMNPVNKLYKKSLLVKNDIKFSDTFFLEDHALSLGATLFAKRIAYIPEQLYVYRTHHKHSLSHTNDDKMLKCFSEYKKMERIVLRAHADRVMAQTINFIASSANMRASAVQSSIKQKYVKIAKDYFKKSVLLQNVSYENLYADNKNFLHSLFFHMDENSAIDDPLHFNLHHSAAHK